MRKFVVLNHTDKMVEVNSSVTEMERKEKKVAVFYADLTK
jgi:hypothetical protein